MFIAIVTTCMYYASLFINEQTSNTAENMVGHKLGEFAATRIFKGHSAAKKVVEA